jgi:putative methyltransferase (TIGR04325 family)
VILEHVTRAALIVKRGEAAYEQDARVFETRDYVWPVLASLLWIAGQRGQNLHVLDFGGSLGSNYYRHLPFFQRLRGLKWSIVEQPHYVQTGQLQFQDDRLRFFEDIESCLAWSRPDVVLLSGVLQYLPEPQRFLADLRGHAVDFLLFDRLPFVERDRDRLCLQHVGEPNYPAVYPAWFFSRSALLSAFAPTYRLLEEFESGDHANIPSEYRGLLFEKVA